MTVAAVAARGGTSALPERLRAETSQWHQKVEAVTDIPGRVRTRDGYVALLSRLSGLHAGLEAQLCAPTWDGAWLGVGLDIAAHRRVGLLVADLDALGVRPTVATEQPPFPGFGQALGCLYVLEGSALGGRVVAGMVRAAIGEVPTAFLSGRGRGHQWPALRGALRRFDVQGGDTNAVVAGALSTFEEFARQLAGPALQR
jgi:heme oxygenase